MTTSPPLITFYGDDLTGSTAVLEALRLNGVSAMLFMDPPSPDEVQAYDLDAVGVAGTSRSMSPHEMESELPEIFNALHALGAPLFHYKVCSTFDSAPQIGSIGKAIELGQRIFDSPFVPVSQGSTVPHDRHVVFSNLFAEQEAEIYRIDRHPTMKSHPKTPMDEGDLRVHLGDQTDLPIGAIHHPALDSLASAKQAMASTVESGNEIVIMDALGEDDLATIGHLFGEHAEPDAPLFTVGSSGIEKHALPSYWRATGALDSGRQEFRPADTVENIVVISGSASPITATQISWARRHGFELIRIDSPTLIRPGTREAEFDRVIDAAMNALARDQNPIIASVLGPDDSITDETKQAHREAELSGNLGRVLGGLQGRMLQSVLARQEIPRVCIAGGDTSGAVLGQLDVTALQAVAPTAPGAPLCEIVSNNLEYDELQIVLKGGQAGEEAYFERVRRGGSDV